VLQYYTEDGTKLSIRPSGTEPKIKFYIEVVGIADSREALKKAEEAATEKIELIRKELNI
jgi:phosphoglucomutase